MNKELKNQFGKAVNALVNTMKNLTILKEVLRNEGLTQEGDAVEKLFEKTYKSTMRLFKIRTNVQSK